MSDEQKTAGKFSKEAPVRKRADIFNANGQLVTMPWDEDAEQGVLSCFMHDPVNLIPDFRATVVTEAFYHPQNQAMYLAMVEFTENVKDPKPLEYILFTNFLRDTGQLDKAGGVPFLSKLLSFVPTPAHYGHYVGILKEKLKLRQIIKVCGEAIDGTAVYHEEGVDELLGKVQQEILAIGEEAKKGGPQQCRVYAMQAFDEIEFAMNNIGNVSGLQTGHVDLDRILNGLEKQDRIVVGARPSIGKTSLVLNWAKRLSLVDGRPGAMFSLDGSGKMLMKRCMAEWAGVSLGKIRMGMASREELNAITRATSVWSKAPFYIDERPALSAHQICATARRLKRTMGLEWMAVDYFQVMTYPGEKDKRIELDRCSQALLALAQELDISLIEIVQLNREAEKGKGRPKMSDIKECGQVEQDASKIILLSREEREWGQFMAKGDAGEEDIADWDKDNAPPLLLNEIPIIADVVKNKDGPTGPVWLRFLKDITRYRSLVPDKKLFSSAYNKKGREKMHESEVKRKEQEGDGDPFGGLLEG